jgi:hypothetical protein
MPKIRYGARCGWRDCRGWMHPGATAVRFRGHWWHARCAAAYLRSRAELKQRVSV